MRKLTQPLVEPLLLRHPAIDQLDVSDEEVVDPSTTLGYPFLEGV